MTKITKKEVELKEQLNALLNTERISSHERQALQTSLNSIDQGGYYNRVVFELKHELSSLILQGTASESVIQFLAELSRIEPSSGPASIWNGLIKR
jgi:DNA-directed RNA polymerase specialized sigma54-like protein